MSANLEKGDAVRIESVEYSSEHSEAPKSTDPYYFDSNGLRIDGDGYDHTRFNPRTIAFVMTTLGCSLALCGSQIVPLLYVTVVTGIAKELGTPHLRIWLLSSFLVAQGAISPFVGPLADLFGRKMIFLVGLGLNIVGAIVCATTPNAYGFIAGEVLMGFGTVVEELLAIAIVGESVPTSKRPLYGALILSAIIPWSPGTMYANWMVSANWRWIGAVVAMWNFINLIVVGLFYWPPPRINARGLTRAQMIARIDFTGGFLLTTGLVFLLVGLNWGGQDYPWSSSHVVSFMCIGFALFIAFGIWEWKLVKFPMYPRRIIHVPKPFFCMMMVIFAAGVNYIPLVVFWPVETIAVFNADRFEVGLFTLPIGVGILSGAMIAGYMLGKLQNWVTLTMFGFCVMQTIACACLAVVDKNNINTAWAPVVFSLIGVGGVLVPNQVIITVITPDDLIASVTALTVGLRSQAQVIGLAIFYNQLVTSITANSWEIVLPAMLEVQYINVTQIYDMMESLTAIPYKEYAPTVPAIASGRNYEIVHEATKEVFIRSFRHIWLITIAFGLAACVAAGFMGSLNQYMDDHVAVVYEHKQEKAAKSTMTLNTDNLPSPTQESRAWLERHDPETAF